MEFGDIIYFLVLVFFMILGFFNDSRKKKRAKQAETESRPLVNMEQEMPPRPQIRQKIMPPPVTAVNSKGEGRKEFRSSLDLVSIHDKQSSQPGYAFDYDANSFYEKEQDSTEESATYHENNSGEAPKSLVHPLIQNLKGDAAREELKKVLIYSEIMLRKY